MRCGIENFQILKDGSATSIYGARAMAGVIVVTTKQGRSGHTSIAPVNRRRSVVPMPVTTISLRLVLDDSILTVMGEDEALTSTVFLV